MTSGRATVWVWSVAMSPSKDWTVTRGRAAAAAAAIWALRKLREGEVGYTNFGLKGQLGFCVVFYSVNVEVRV